MGFNSAFKGLNMEPIGCPETSVTNYHSTLRNIQEGIFTQLWKPEITQV